MRPKMLIQTIKELYGVRRTICIEGSPGGGKTSMVRQVARDVDVPYVELHLPTMPVEDFGVPDIMGDRPTFGYKLPEWFPRKGVAPDDGILCIDDRNTAGNELQKVLANICQARTLHGVPMANWMVVSTGNRTADRSGANRVLGHLSNRETVYELETHLDDTTAWMLANGVNPIVVAFLRFRPGLVHDYDPQRRSNPTPRAWVEGVSDVLGVVSPDAEYESFKGAVGEGAAAEFTGFVRIYRKLPNPDAVLLNPDTADVPSDLATLYALSGALSHRATNANFNRLCTYAERMPAAFSVLAISMAVKRDVSLTETAAFTQWAVRHQDVLF